MAQLTLPKALRVVVELLVVGACTLVFIFAVAGIAMSVLGAPGVRDFVSYWASGQLLSHHADPYSTNAILALERSAGYAANTPALIMRNPPSALLMALPLGLLHCKPAELLWTMVMLAALVASVRIVWILHGRPETQKKVLGLSFGPALVCIISGQMGIFMLFGLALFLRLHRSRPFLAGVSLWLCMMKPHLFLPFGCALLLWVIATRSYAILAGVASALSLSTAVALALDPHVWLHYRQMLRADKVATTPIPCLSIALRQAISVHTLWLQYIPVVLGCVWAIAYFRRHRDDWDWMVHGSPLMLVSILVAPYSWITDQSLLIPALLHGAWRTPSRGLILLLALASAVIEVGIFRGAQPFHSNFYIWTAPAWLAWYLYAVRTNPVEPRGGPQTSDPFHRLE